MIDAERLRNKLIVYEGYDKTGKSSVAKLMVDFLNAKEVPAIFTFQPGDKAWGTEAVLMRSLCIDKRHDLHPLANLFAFLLDRTQQMYKVVMPALEEGKTVVSDRWWHSTVAYQFYGKQLLELFDLDESFAFWLNQVASLGVEPDYVFYFPESLNIEREVDINDQFETADDGFSKRVREAYEAMAQKNNMHIVHPGKSAEQTLENLLYDLM